MQFHTPGSFDAKMQTRPWYKALRLPGLPEAEVSRLREEMAEIFRRVELPPDVERLTELRLRY